MPSKSRERTQSFEKGKEWRFQRWITATSKGFLVKRRLMIVLGCIVFPSVQDLCEWWWCWRGITCMLDLVCTRLDGFLLLVVPYAQADGWRTWILDRHTWVKAMLKPLLPSTRQATILVGCETRVSGLGKRLESCCLKARDSLIMSRCSIPTQEYYACTVLMNMCWNCPGKQIR